MIEVNGRAYRLARQPTVVVCVEGCEPACISEAIAHGHTPWMKQVHERGTVLVAEAAMPTFSNPDDVSIATGVAPAGHDICGHTPFDPAGGHEISMNDPPRLRAPTLLAALASAGQSVAVVTARDKLRRLLGHGLDGICFSAEKADEATDEENGIGDVLLRVGLPRPAIHSADLSEFVLAAGVELMSHERHPDVMYLSTGDDVQHRHAPGSDSADAFYRMIDGYLARLDAMGCVIALTADHGMNAKTRHDGSPDIIDLQAVLDARLGAGLDAPLRSHGESAGQKVPLVVNRRLHGIDPARRFRNFDAFDLVLNHVD